MALPPVGVGWTSLSARQQALSILQNRVTASVALISALGGGWDVGQLPANPG